LFEQGKIIVLVSEKSCLLSKKGLW